MYEFMDISGKKVELCFEHPYFEENAEHVFVICEGEDGWVLTHHAKRGWEFPGGKQEAGETLEEAAHREVYEETGALLSSLVKIGEYKVSGHQSHFVKAVYWGRVSRLEEKINYFETKGPVIVRGDLLQNRFDSQYSFIMQDGVVEHCLKRIQRLRS